MSELVVRRLRAATLDLHAAAERHVRILDDDATIATYVRFLDRMHGVHVATEAAFADHAELAIAGFDAAARCKSALIRADLAQLHAVPNESRCVIPDVRGIARGLGAAYVIEGSTLGGAFVRSRLRLRDVPTAFLAGYGKETGPMWKRFVAVLDQARVDADHAIAAARAMFRSLIDWLDEPAREPPQPFCGLRGEAGL
ncbi:MAG TPA: biliverdin-producing heme oxygenase [Kofleriaceae bacterium]|nr:biliverdin-producing heme oxygenase [Kofleriaceae bacterium]